MSQTTSKVDPDDKKMMINRFNLKKTILGTIQGDQFLYIFSQVLLQVHLLIVKVFFSQFLDPFSQGLPLILYYSPSFISTLHV